MEEAQPSNATETTAAVWNSVEQVLEKWLGERRQLLVFYCAFGQQGGGAPPLPRWLEVRRFCQVLVDYVSAGHFEIYDQLIHEAEAFDDPDAADLVRGLYPDLHATTQVALDFNDKYATEEFWENRSDEFLVDISALGESLSSRFELEDQLIARLHGAHRGEQAV